MLKNEQEGVEETVEEEVEELDEVLDEDTTDWKERAKKLEEKAIAQRARTKELKAQLSTFQKAVLPGKEPKINDNKPDYAKLAYLRAEGVSQEDHSFLLDEANNTGKELTDLLNFNYIKEELKNRKEAREAKGALPTSSKRSSPASRDTVEYHLAKQTPLKEIQDVDLRRKVLQAKLKANQNSSKFSGASVV